MPNLINSTILGFLKANGPQLDFEIAAALKMPLVRLRTHGRPVIDRRPDLLQHHPVQGRREDRRAQLSAFVLYAAGRAVVEPGAAKRAATTNEALPD